MPDPEPPVPVYATFNDATLEVVCVFDRRLAPGPSFLTNWIGFINRGIGRWEFGALANPIADQKRVVFTANIIGPAVAGPNALGYNRFVAPFLVGWTAADVAPFLTLNLTLI